MGYYTEYSLETIPKNNGVIAHLREVDENARYAITDEGDSLDSLKWYDHSEDMKKFSKQYPDILFILSGVGEDSGDIWRGYFKNGKAQIIQAKIVFEEFDPEKLK